jgi:hypothetical protein
MIVEKPKSFPLRNVHIAVYDGDHVLELLPFRALAREKATPF